jgi:hypothetical protein
MNVEAALRPAAVAVDALDGARSALLRFAARTAGLRCIVTSRDIRLGVQSCLSAAVLALATLKAPGVLLVVGPALFGVPHLVGDVRHIVIRSHLSRGWIRVIVVACAALVAIRLGEIAAPSIARYALVEAVAGWIWVAAGVVLGSRAGKSVRRGLLLAPPVAMLAVVSMRSPELARAIFAYAHNAVALVVWVVMFRSRRVAALPAVVMVGAIAVLFASGSLMPWAHWEPLWGRQVVAESMAVVGRNMAPGAATGMGLSCLYLQAVHYAAWVSWIPQDDLQGCGSATFRMTLRALRRELGVSGCVLVTAAAIAVFAGSLVCGQRTRTVYFSVAAFHAWLELAALAYFIAAGRHVSGSAGAWSKR